MYSIDRRNISCHVYSFLNSLRETAKLIKVSHTTVSLLLEKAEPKVQRWLINVSRTKYNNTNRTNNSKSNIITEILKASIKDNPMITHKEIKCMVQDIFHFSISTELIRTILKRNKLTRKKIRFFGKAKNQENLINDFLTRRTQYISENRLFFSLDETSFGRHGKPTYGYSLKGSPIHIQKKLARVTTSSMMTIVSSTQIIKTCVINGSFNSEKFYQFLKDLQLPEYAVILLDNVRFHHSNVVKELCSNRKWVLFFIPPYSPWFNPIEEVFSIIKRSYYKDSTIQESIASVTEKHLKSFFKHALGHQGILKNI